MLQHLAPEQGLTTDETAALPSVIFRAPPLDAAHARSLGVGELKRLLAAHGIPLVGCVERSHLLEQLDSHRTSSGGAAGAGAEAEEGCEGGAVCEAADCSVCMCPFVHKE